MQLLSHRLPVGSEMKNNWGWYALTEYRRRLQGQLSALKYTEKRHSRKIPYSPDTLFSLETLNFSNLTFKALGYKLQCNIISIMFFIHFSLIASSIYKRNIWPNVSLTTIPSIFLPKDRSWYSTSALRTPENTRYLLCPSPALYLPSMLKGEKKELIKPKFKPEEVYFCKVLNRY